MKVLVIYSGGLDSTVLLHKLLDKGMEVEAISFNYGQRHKKELEYAIENCKKLKVRHDIIDLTSIKLDNSALTDNRIDVPEGLYETNTMKTTFVPNRNMIFLSIAAGIAMGRKIRKVALAIHSGDHDLYRDCRAVFITYLQIALNEGNYSKVEIMTPFITYSKKDIVEEGRRLGVDFDKTWSCYKGGDVPCGKCGTCIERQEALNG